MSITARITLIAVYLLALLAIATSFPGGVQPPYPWLSFLALALLGSLAACSQTHLDEQTRLNWETLFLFAGLFLLPFWLFCAQVIVVRLTGGLFRANASPLQNASSTRFFAPARDILAGRFGLLVFAAAGGRPLGSGPLDVTAAHNFGAVLAAALACAASIQILTGLALYTIHGISWRDSRMLRDILLVEFPLASAGYCVVLAWNLNPWLMVLFLTPLVLVSLVMQTPRKAAEQLQALQRKNTALTESLSQSQKLTAELFKTIASVTDARDPFGGGHAHQVAIYATAIARELNLSPAQTEDLRRAAYLHDIGKMSVPEAILNKPNRLTDAEYAAIQQHAAAGAEMLAPYPRLHSLAAAIRHHHERWDGLGYPEGLAGENIPLEARILHVCDSVEMMASDRPYRTGLDVEQIIAELRRCRSTQFDPLVADVFIHIVEMRGRSFVINAARQAAEERSRTARAHATRSRPARPLHKRSPRTS